MTEMNKDARLWATLAHASGIIFGFLGPLVIWLIKKDEFPFVDDQGKEALNFQISVFIYAIICLILAFVIIGVFLLMALGPFALIVSIIAIVKANNGEAYRYPLCIRIIK